MKFPPRHFTTQQREFVEQQLPVTCDRGGWHYRICAAAPDHVHLLCDVVSKVHGEKVRRLVKRWLGQALSELWPLPKDATWWAEEGSNKAIDSEDYLNTCFVYIRDQRTTPFSYAVSGPGTARLANHGNFLTATRGVPAPDCATQKRAALFYHFHVNLFASPQGAFKVTWEEAATELERLPRMIFELDGSFVISGSCERAGPSSAPTSRRRWQVDGHLFDFGGRLHRVELHGYCPTAVFDDLLRCIGWPDQELIFEMVREGVTLEERAFRSRVSTDTSR